MSRCYEDVALRRMDVVSGSTLIEGGARALE